MYRDCLEIWRGKVELFSSLSLRERGTASAVERVSKVGHSSIYKNFDVPSTPSQSPVGASSPGGRSCCMSDVQQFYGTVPVTATAPVFMINISSFLADISKKEI